MKVTKIYWQDEGFYTNDWLWYSPEDGQRIMHYIHKQNKAEGTSLNNDSAQLMFLSILGNLPSYLLIGFYTVQEKYLNR